MEEGKIEDIFYRTGHPYTAGLLASIPKRTKEKLVPIFGTPPDLLNPPKGCPFAARCSRAMKPVSYTHLKVFHPQTGEFLWMDVLASKDLFGCLHQHIHDFV